MKKVLIWAESSPKIGMGHVKRCLVLVNELKKLDFEITFLQRISKIESCTGTECSLDCLHHVGDYPIICCNTVEQFLTLTPLVFDLLITDSYDLNEDIIKLARKKIKHVAVIDDLNNLLSYHVDLLINGDHQAPRWSYSCTGKLLLGLEYLLIDPKFKVEQFEKRRRLLVMAGAYNDELMDQTMAVLKPMQDEFNIYPVNLSKYPSQIPLETLMQQSYLAVTACGMSMYECLACGTPVIGLITAENQRASAESLAKIHQITLVDMIDELPEKIKIAKYRECMIPLIIDNHGAERVALEIKELINNG